ncbi:MAG TPA: hypothetical protein VHP33_35130 [Polyangiaceae bacterium]|nr:hypothetical protein [Polyangiaceae bacterium]
MALALAAGAALLAPPARADSTRGSGGSLGDDLERVKRSFSEQTRSEALKLRLLERGEQTPIVVPPWALDSARGDCTTLVLLSPPSTQFVVRLHPWQGLQANFASRAGALQLTRCGKERISLLRVLLEMRSPRAVVYPLVAVGADAPAPLVASLPERDTGPEAPSPDPGREPGREALAGRVRRFEENARNAGATSVETSSLANPGYVRLVLRPGCHRLLATARDGAPAYTLLLSESEDQAQRFEASPAGDVRHELCTARERRLLASVDTDDGDQTEAERSLSVAHFALPRGLPGRFGPEVAERLLGALGKSAAPAKLGPLVLTTLGAQGRTPLPRSLLPQTCYQAAAIVLHGSTQAISLGVRAQAINAEATSSDAAGGAQLAFCTGRSGQVELDVEARGLGLSWLLFLFQTGPARPVEAP